MSCNRGTIKNGGVGSLKKGNEIIWLLSVILLVGVILLFIGSTRNKDSTKEKGQEITAQSTQTSDQETNSSEPVINIKPTKIPVSETFIDGTGMTLETRISTPENYKRIAVTDGSFGQYIRKFPLLEDGAKVMLYNNTEKWTQKLHAAVFDVSIGEKDLQQCADSIIRMYAEYFYAAGKFEQIKFHLTNGFLMKYTTWRDGYRIKVVGNDVTWVKKQEEDTSYEGFLKYLTSVFLYAGTISLNKEGKEVKMSEMQIGDMFIYGGSPGHCVLVVDIAENEKKEKCFLLAQGYMPAQGFHVIRNPKHMEDPWYYESEFSYPFETIQWTFQEGSLKRFEGFE